MIVKNGSASARPRPKQLLRAGLTVLKIALPALILAWLIYDCQRKDPEAFRRIWESPKNWWLLGLSLVALLAAQAISIYRWFLLVRALEIPFRLSDAFRLGFLGYFLNFIGPGQVGGDLFKAVFLAREQTSRRSEAVATILLDRVAGMFSLFVVASLAIVMTGVEKAGQLAPVLRLVQLLTVAGFCGLTVLLLPARWARGVIRKLESIPRIGKIVKRVADALRLYRRRIPTLLLVGCLGLSVHLLAGLTVHWIDLGLFPSTPTMAEHTVMTALANVVGAVPISPGGLGTFEIAMAELFRTFPTQTFQEGQGIAVSLGYRLNTIVIAAIGMGYYWLHRTEIKGLLGRKKIE